VPFANVNKTRLFYRLEGQSGKPLLVLSHSLGCDHSMWAPQMPDLLDHFQVLRYDTRGHGASDVPAGDYTMEHFGRDVLGLLDARGIAKAAFCGLSMGGAIGLWLAVNAPQRLSALLLANTAAKFGTPDLWNARRKDVIDGGMPAITDAVMQRFFSPDKQTSGVAQSTRAILLGTDPQGYAACCAGLRDADLRDQLGKINLPTLVIGSDRDASTPWDPYGAMLAGKIPGARAIRLDTAHLSNLEQPRAFTRAVLEFLLPAPDPSDPLERESAGGGA